MDEVRSVGTKSGEHARARVKHVVYMTRVLLPHRNGATPESPRLGYIASDVIRGVAIYLNGLDHF